jgi:hypothetical protein
MGHCVTGLIAKTALLETFARERNLHAPTALAQGLCLLPLWDTDLDKFLVPPLTGYVNGFNYLSEQLIRELKIGSSCGSLMYFETEYFGGDGAQGATVFREGELIFGPQSASLGPINEALAILGVRVVPPACDEFESVGLHSHRDTEDWLAERTSSPQ